MKKIVLITLIFLIFISQILYSSNSPEFINPSSLQKAGAQNLEPTEKSQLLNENNPQIVSEEENDLRTNEVVQPNSLEFNSVDFTKIYEGETVKVDRNFNKYFPIGENTETVSCSLDECWIVWGKDGAFNAGDGVYYQFRTQDDTTRGTAGTLFIRVQIQLTALRSGTLYYTWRASDNDGASTEISSSYYLSSSDYSTYVGAEKLLVLDALVTCTTGAGAPSNQINLVRQDGGSTYSDSLSTQTADTSVAGLTYCELWFDELYFRPDSISGQIRSSFQYTSPSTQIHFLEVDAIDWQMDIDAFTPLHWEFSSIVPDATVMWDDTNQVYNITNTAPTNYIMRFVSAPGLGNDYPHQPYIVAINDVSSNYMQCEGFECGSNQDWISRNSPRDFDSLSVNTSIVYQGSFSLRLFDTDTSNSHAIMRTLDSGEYYISFSVYIDEYTSGTFDFQTWDGSAWISHDIDETIQNRWQTFYFYIDVRGTNTIDSHAVNINFSGISSFNMVVFLDSFQINKVSTNVETNDYGEYLISANFIYWDGKLNRVASNIDANLMILDRTAQTYIDDFTSKTDTQGKISWIWKGVFDIKEYIIRASTDKGNGVHYFTTYDKETTSTEPNGFTKDANVVLGTAVVDSSDQITMTASPSDTPGYVFLHSDITYRSPIIEGQIKRQNSGGTRISLSTLNEYVSSTNDYTSLAIDLPSGTTAGSATLYQFLSGTATALGTLGTITIANGVYYDYRVSFSGRVVKFWFDNAFVGAVTIGTSSIFYEAGEIGWGKTWNSRTDYYDNQYIGDSGVDYYFTPIPSTYEPYSYETKTDESKNYWDFSESTEENGMTIASSYTESVTNGYYEAITSAANRHLYTEYEWDVSTEDYFYFRFQCTAGNRLLPELWTELYSYNNALSYITCTGSWEYYTYSLVSKYIDSDGLYIDIYIETSGTTLKIDYLGFSPNIDQGYAYEFEEQGYVEGWAIDGAGTIDVHDSYLDVDQTGTGANERIELYSFLDTSNYDTIVLKVRAKGNTDEIVAWQTSATKDGWVTGTASSLFSNAVKHTLTSSFQIFEFPLYSDGLLSELRIYYYQGGDPALNNVAGDGIDVEFIRFIDSSQQPDLVLDETSMLAYFDNQDNETQFYQTWINGSNYGIYEEYELFYLPQELDIEYIFTYTQIYSTTIPQFVQIPSTIFEFAYINTLEEEDFQLLFTDFSYDVDAGLIYFSWFTNYGNTTAEIFDNSTSLGSPGPEESIAVTFLSSNGLHDIGINITNGVTLLWTLYTSFTIVEPTSLYEVWIDIYDGIGLGIDFEKVKVFASYESELTRVGKSFYWPNSTIDITITDYFDVELATETFNLNTSRINYLGIQVPMFELTFSNPYDVSVLMTITRAGNILNVVIPANASFSVTFSTGIYIFDMQPIYNDPVYNDNIIGNEPPILYAPTQDSYEHTTIAGYRVWLEDRFEPEPPKEPGLIDKAMDSKFLKIIFFISGLIGVAELVRRYRKKMKIKRFEVL